MVFVNLRDCQHSALDGLDGKQRGGSYGDAGQSVLPPIKRLVGRDRGRVVGITGQSLPVFRVSLACVLRSEEHTSELQSPMYLVCRLLLEKKNTINKIVNQTIQINHL